MGVVSQYMANPGPRHWVAVKQILRYLKGTMYDVLRYGGSYSNLQVVGYCDADYAGDIDSRKSTTGYVFLLNGGAISWNSKKQPIKLRVCTNRNSPYTSYFMPQQSPYNHYTPLVTHSLPPG